jgi:hypothetical protein
MTFKQVIIISALILSLGLCCGAMAEPVWLCAVTDAVSVDENGTIGEPDLGGLERPTFFRVDADKKELTLVAPASRRGEVTKIDAVRQGKGIWIFYGLEQNRAWNLVISEKGPVTMSVTSDGATWSVFGNALQEDGEIDAE